MSLGKKDKEALSPRNSASIVVQYTPVEDVITHLKTQQVYDYLQIAHDHDLCSYLASGADTKEKSDQDNIPQRNEKLQFADEVHKINKRDKAQKRHLVLTNKALYNFVPKKYKSCRRRIPLSRLSGMVLSRCSCEVVFQVDDDYDYRFVIERRAEALEMASKFYELETGNKLHVQFSPEKDLKAFVTTKNVLLSKLENTFITGKKSSISNGPSTEDMSTESHSPRAQDGGPSNNRTVSVAVSKGRPQMMVTKGFRAADSLREGWLAKRKGTSEKWDRKYFILSQDKLTYFSPRIKGVVSLIDCVVEPFSGFGGGKEEDKSAALQFGKFAWCVEYRGSYLSKRKIYLAAETKEDMEVWQDAFDGKGKKAIHLEGWLKKVDPKEPTSWRSRYFVIRKDRCWYFEMEKKGDIALAEGVSAHDAKTVEATELHSDNFAGFESKSRFAYRFNVSDESRQYNLSADSNDDKLQWILAIEKAGRKHTRGISVDKKEEVPTQVVEAISQEAPEGEATLVFTDVQSSTTLWEKAPDAMDISLERHDIILRRLLKKYRGYEVKTEGDAFMVTFFSPLDALLWCLEVQVALNGEEWEPEVLALDAARQEKNPAGQLIFNGIRIRMGVHGGKVNARRNPVTGRMDYFGPNVNRAARVSDAGHGGQIVMTQEMFDCLQDKGPADERLAGEHWPAVKDLGFHHLKGIKETVRIYEILPKVLAERSQRFPPIRTIDNETEQKGKDVKQKVVFSDDEEEDEDGHEHHADAPQGVIKVPELPSVLETIGSEISSAEPETPAP